MHRQLADLPEAGIEPRTALREGGEGHHVRAEQDDEELPQSLRCCRPRILQPRVVECSARVSQLPRSGWLDLLVEKPIELFKGGQVMQGTAVAFLLLTQQPRV